MLATIKQRFAGAPLRSRPHGDTARALGNGSALTEPAEQDASNWYLLQAKDFEKSKVEAALDQAKRADRRSIYLAAIALAAVIGIGALGVLKRPNPPAVLRVNATTGAVTVLPTTAGRVTFGEKADRADLRRYVEMRESYDWETLKDMYNAVRVMSDDHEKDMYDLLVRGPQAPLKMLKDQARVVAKVGVITYVGETAQVFFSRTLIPPNQGLGRTEPTYWVATIHYRHDDVPEGTDAQDVDPTGLRVTSYTVVRDYTRAPADNAVPATASSAAAATAGAAPEGSAQ
jgi:type IV secretion system protein VirB8